MENRSIVNCCGSRADLTIDLKDGQLKTYFHDKGGWIFYTTNVVVALSIIGDKKPSDLGYADDSNKIIDIIDSELPYDKELVLNSLNKDKDLDWIYWLSGGNSYWMQGYDREYMYDDLREFLEDEEERDNAYDKIMETYHEDKILEKLKSCHESDLMNIINSSSTWNEFYTKMHTLEQLIQTFIFEYLTEFIYDCGVV